MAGTTISVSLSQGYRKSRTAAYPSYPCWSLIIPSLLGKFPRPFHGRRKFDIILYLYYLSACFYIILILFLSSSPFLTQHLKTHLLSTAPLPPSAPSPNYFCLNYNIIKLTRSLALNNGILKCTITEIPIPETPRPE